MSNTMLKGLIWAVFLAVCLSACGSETSGEDSGGNGDIGLHSFTGDVRSISSEGISMIWDASSLILSANMASIPLPKRGLAFMLNLHVKDFFRKHKIVLGAFR